MDVSKPFQLCNSSFAVTNCFPMRSQPLEIIQLLLEHPDLQVAPQVLYEAFLNWPIAKIRQNTAVLLLCSPFLSNLVLFSLNPSC